jgi:homopolymeric O-antigen transport system ATP-binding protein
LIVSAPAGQQRSEARATSDIIRSYLNSSMGNSAIHCESLSKRYRLGERPTNSFREALMNKLAASLRRKQGANGNDWIVWALRDVSFDIREGEVVGIIGRNGAGKSTLLKVLSRITEPTQGCAEVRGRVGSLLEVGTGFHPELTGRENIYLNGAILGMRKAEIARKFDEIVAFAEIEKFLDTPVKRYSSGMYVRLAFAVAAHLETEILLVDEVLAVGDAQFQKKCFDKVRSVGQSGRTILFVSHNMAALRQVCQRGIVLQGGTVVADGEINGTADLYLAAVGKTDATALLSETPSYYIRDMGITCGNAPVIKTMEEVEVRVEVTAKTDIVEPGVYVCFQTLENVRIAGLDFRDFAPVPPLAAGERMTLGFTIHEFPLLPGSYQMEVYVKDMARTKSELVPQSLRFEVAETPVYGGRKLDHWFGLVALNAVPQHERPRP